MSNLAFDYSKWDKIELSDDEEDFHPNIDKDSWIRLKHRTRVENEEDDSKKQAGMQKRLQQIREELKTFGEAGQTHLKAKKLREEADKIEADLAKMEKNRKWNADNMCKTVEDRAAVSGKGAEVGPEPRLTGEAVADGYCEYVEEHEDLLERFIALGRSELEEVQEFLREHGGTLLQGEHAESYVLLDCLEKEMNDEHDEMVLAARQHQLLTQIREFSRSSSRPARDGVMLIFERLLENESVKESFDETVADFVKRIEKRAVEKKKEMDAEAEAEAEAESEPGPGGLKPMEVLRTLPEEMQAAFRTQDIARLHAAVESLPEEEARYHLKRCEESGLWVPNPEAGPPPYQQ